MPRKPYLVAKSFSVTVPQSGYLGVEVEVLKSAQNQDEVEFFRFALPTSEAAGLIQVLQQALQDETPDQSTVH